MCFKNLVGNENNKYILKETITKGNILHSYMFFGNEGIGKPEPLAGNLTGFWSRRINEKDRLIYKIDEENVYILACKYHYSDSKEEGYYLFK